MRTWEYIGALARNGQMLGRDTNIVRSDKAISLFCISPEPQSLELELHSVYGRKSHEWLTKHSPEMPKVEVLGEVEESGRICSCNIPSSYILFTTYMQIAPPVVCGDCSGHVPLYKLPYPDESREHGAICNWESTYKCCDELYMLSGVGERFGLRQIQNPKSPLSQDGISLCNRMTKLTSKPFYYISGPTLIAALNIARRAAPIGEYKTIHNIDSTDSAISAAW
jgi:predicted  nucleic acid-binding Zn ribbon protein